MTGIMIQYLLDDNMQFNWFLNKNIKYIKKRLIKENYNSNINIITMQYMSYDDFINYVEKSRGTN